MTTLTAVFLCLAVLVLSPATGQGSGIVSSCCLTTSNTKIRVAQISSYFRQNTGRCPVEALVFTSVTGRKICSDPSDPWAKKAKAVVDARRKSSTTVTVSSQKTPDTTSSLRKTTPSTPNATDLTLDTTASTMNKASSMLNTKDKPLD
ncbi:hypothetical protein JZ751_008201 [Albula glossodonta]|uniref:C-C motif chemokine n=1 Tax=Albula glossodonta TaxID=121402 RepID=A0A8T2MND2_9TELE|nr:hypothetical protein JZ751_008201 [Albula glossodonta]